MLRSFNVVCPLCEDNIYPFPDKIDKIYRCQCGAVYKITWRSDMEDAMSQLVRSFLKDGDPLEGRSEDSILCHALVYEDIENLIRMKMEYEAVKYIRQIQALTRITLKRLALSG